MNYRQEVKHIISAGDAAMIRSNLSAVARIDPHAEGKGYYLVRSLYFDDPDCSALQDKLDGMNKRRKYRIRYYDNCLNYMVLECKIRQDDMGYKPREVLTPEETRRILRGETTWMASSGRPLICALYADMRTRLLAPKTVVEYKRIPYLYGPGNVRVTVDWAIRAGRPSGFLKPGEQTFPIGDHIILLEIKWDQYLPEIIRKATALNSRMPAAFSKYAACSFAL